MIKWLKPPIALMAVLLLLVGLAAGQNSYYTNQNFGVNPFSSANGAYSVTSPILIPFGWVRVCTVPATGSPCSPLAQIYDIFGNPLSVIGGNFGQLQANNIGQYTFQCIGGSYEIQVAPTTSNTP